MEALVPLSEVVQEFLRERIHSIEELEALLLLGGEPARYWSDSEVVEALKISPALARSALNALVYRGYVSLFRPPPAQPDSRLRRLR